MRKRQSGCSAPSLPCSPARQRFPAAVAARSRRLSRRAAAWDRARNDAGVTLDDLDLVETHDCFTIAELIEYEAMGLAAARRRLSRRAGGDRREGRSPADQPSGGLKSKGHPIGATGVSHPRHGLPSAHERSAATCRSMTRSSPVSSTWAAPPSPTTCRSWSDANDETPGRLPQGALRPSRSGS